MSIVRRLVPARTRTWARSLDTPLSSIVGVRTTLRAFVMTYDDGPEPGGTDEILRVLSTFEAHATFFMLLNRARKYPSLVRSIVAEGHEVALHGPDHRAISRMRRNDVITRTLRAKDELEQLAERQIRWFRPPYGRQSMTSFLAVRATDLEPVMWGATTWDSRHASHTERIERATKGMRPGVILLAHDGYADVEDGARGGDRPDVDRARLTAAVLERYDEHGLRAVSLGEALASGTAERGLRFQR